METKAAILAAGTEAVSIYREISGCSHDNELPERFISSLMAVNLHKALGLLARAERQYTQIAKDLGLKLDPESRTNILGRSADIVLYDGARPVSLIEVKKFDEGKKADEIERALHKGDPLFPAGLVDICVGVMVCEVPGKDLVARGAELEQMTGVRWLYSDPVLSRNREWYWCFGCGYIGDAP